MNPITSHLLIRGDSGRLPVKDGSVHCVCTSPPYYGLRDYGLEPSWWPSVTFSPMPGLPSVTIPPMRSCLGLEPTPEAFVGHIVLVFREVWRVLRSDGTAWVNFGDSYSSGGRTTQVEPSGNVRHPGMKNGTALRPPVTDALKPKDLMGIPWRVAFALQADGWYLRSDIIWAKANPMPESVTDRPSKAHEYIFLLAKSADYYYDVEAVKEKVGEPVRMAASFRDGGVYTQGRSFNNHSDKGKDTHGDGDRSLSGRNRRTVWDIATQPTPDAHFATWPQKLVEPMILAGTSEKGCCPDCGAPYRRLISRDRTATRPGEAGKVAEARNKLPAEEPGRDRGAARFNASTLGSLIGNRDPQRHVTLSRTLGWEPGCSCNAGPSIPCTVLDPFNGSGTTGQVAAIHGRNYIGIDLNPTYLTTIAVDRVERGVRPHKDEKPSVGSLSPLPGQLGLAFAETNTP